MNPYKIVSDFEEVIADFAGSKYGVAVESCTSAIFLSLVWVKQKYPQANKVLIPRHTYPGVPCSIIHAGLKVIFNEEKYFRRNPSWGGHHQEWEGEYELCPLNIWDAALRFRKGMYHGGFQCLSFHIKKLLPIGRGGMILTDDKEAYEWFKKARFDGRNPIPLLEDDFTMLGWNCYMQPSDAARGLQLFQAMGDKVFGDIPVKSQGYPDLSKFKIYQQ